MAATEKNPEVQTAPSAPAKQDVPPPPQAMVAELLASYTHNMYCAAPRTLEELRLIQDLSDSLGP